MARPAQEIGRDHQAAAVEAVGRDAGREREHAPRGAGART